MSRTATLKWLVIATSIILSGMTMTACHDDNDDDEKSEEQKQAEAAEKAQTDADTFWGIVSQLTAPGTWAEDYTDATFQPNIGVADETNELVRIVYVNDLEHAAKRFANLVSVDGIDETTTKYTYSNPAVGTLTYQRANTGKELATVEVSIKQLPTLRRIVYRNPDESYNSWFTFNYRCYYRFGDVVSRVRASDNVREYWICVRPAFGLEKKEDSHWVSLSPLPQENVWTYHSNTTNQDYRLPNALGTSKEHMQNLAELLYAMQRPTQWANELRSNKSVDFFHDFSRSSLPYMNENFFSRVAQIWRKLGLYKTTMGIESATVENVIANGLNLIYGNKSWSTTFSWSPSLNVATFKAGGTGKKANMHNYKYTSKGNSVRESGFDVNTMYSPDNFPFHNFSSFFGDDNYYWVIRHATGKELSANGEIDILNPIPGVNEEYTYYGYYGMNVTKDDEVEQTNDTDISKQASFLGMSYYRIGDVVKDQDGNPWFCFLPSGTGSADSVFVANGGYTHGDCSWFVTFSGFTGNPNHYTNLPTKEQAKVLAVILGTLVFDGPMAITGPYSKFTPPFDNIKSNAKVDLMKFVATRDTVFYLGDPTMPIKKGMSNHTPCMFINIAYSDKRYEGEKKQPILRFILNNAAFDIKNGQINYNSRARQYIGQTRYAMGNRETMFLQDVASQAKVEQYATDNWVTLPWLTDGNAGDPGGEGYATDVYVHQQPRTISENSVDCMNYLWSYELCNFLHPEFKSMYNEPVTICRIMAVRDHGRENNYSLNGQIIKTVSLTPGGVLTREEGALCVDMLYNSFLIGHQAYEEDGEKSRIEFFGE